MSDYFDDYDYVMLRKQMLADFAQSVNEVLGREGGTIFFLVGERSGARSAWRRLEESLGSKEEALHRLEHLKHEQRWGDIEFSGLDLKRKIGKISLKNCFDVSFKSSIGECFFMRGFITGFLSEIFQDRIATSNTYDKPCNGTCTLLFWVTDDKNG
ncbi:MAG: hypothetical protein M1503_08020 [Thaumarchaeota archaeon]|nr:hypothetical protein [Nitrososphaerota archaeon]MCL5318186.1 hypothetical protein [Nitrososphaerota archaeon]